jgi:hypothetical protein
MESTRRQTLSLLITACLGGCSTGSTEEQGQSPNFGSTLQQLTLKSSAPGLTFSALDTENALDDEDVGAGGSFFLNEGVLISREDPDSSRYGSTRLILGRDVFIGVRKHDSLDMFDESGEGGSGEFIKNPAASPAITFENDFDDGRLRYETKEGGGHSFLTSDPSTEDTNDEQQRLFITDPEDSNHDTARVDAVNCDQVGLGTRRVAFYNKQQNLRGGDGRAGLLFPEPDQNQLRLGMGDKTELTIQPNGFTESLRIGERVTVGNAEAHRPAHLPPQDVRKINSPKRGDVAYHDGSGDAGEGIAYYDGENWNVQDGGTKI